ncbi:MAG: malonyl-ACP O-methyltransferase BioC [Gammaproteobacteria bacterium]|nr:malonyl-ACP O-methyltransferase BioC [Gammaproteobacteria bacterium]
MSDDPYRRDKAGIRRNFNRAAGGYDELSVLQQTVGYRLLDRLDVVRLEPARILDLGSGTGRLSARLAQRYDPARVIQLDLAFKMLKQSSRRRKLADRSSLLCADAENLPIASACVDVAFSNLMFQWVSRLDRALAEIYRSLRPGGLLLFSTFGPDSLAELRASWSGVDDHVHVNAFMDMHDVGDALVRAGFVDPVMETETFTLVYDDGLALMRELKALGAGNVNAGRRRSLTGKRKLRDMLAEYKRRFGNDGLPATFEALYGHAWAPEVKRDWRDAPEPGVHPLTFRARAGTR